MSNYVKTTVIALLVIVFYSCDFKKTSLLNIIHEDGSITRKIFVTTNTRKFLELSKIDVPIDSTWKINVSFKMEQRDTTGNDTIWFINAEKHFGNVDEINQTYLKDKGGNKNLKRVANLAKKFRWFYNVFRYNETVHRINDIICPISGFLTAEELDYVYLPDKISDSLKNGADSVKYKDLDEIVDAKSEIWLATAGFRQWVEEFYSIFCNDKRLNITKDEMLAKELHFLNILKTENSNKTENEDSVYIELFGQEFYNLFKQEVDSTFTAMVEKNSVIWNSNEFEMEIQMPGKVIATNGYAESNNIIRNKNTVLWNVKPEYFLTQDYEMWVVSRVNNYYLWVLTALIFLFTIVSFKLRYKKRAK